VATQFTGYEGQYVPIAETVRSFKEVLAGQHDDLPESAFFLKGSIDDVVASLKGKGGGGGKQEKQKTEQDDETAEEESA
jgi:F0F1-type ATP synthase beta subunit